MLRREFFNVIGCLSIIPLADFPEEHYQTNMVIDYTSRLICPITGGFVCRRILDTTDFEPLWVKDAFISRNGDLHVIRCKNPATSGSHIKTVLNKWSVNEYDACGQLIRVLTKLDYAI